MQILEARVGIEPPIPPYLLDLQDLTFRRIVRYGTEFRRLRSLMCDTREPAFTVSLRSQLWMATSPLLAAQFVLLRIFGLRHGIGD